MTTCNYDERGAATVLIEAKMQGWVLFVGKRVFVMKEVHVSGTE